jgi:hypothetical protein
MGHFENASAVCSVDLKSGKNYYTARILGQARLMESGRAELGTKDMYA